MSADSAERRRRRRRRRRGRHLKKIGIVFILRTGWCRQRQAERDRERERELQYKEGKVCTSFSLDVPLQPSSSLKNLRDSLIFKLNY